MKTLQHPFGENEPGRPAQGATEYSGKAFGSFGTCHCETSI
jgi:hypothetical protein